MSRHSLISNISYTSILLTIQSLSLSSSKVSTTSVGQISAYIATLLILLGVTPTLLSTYNILKNVLEKLSKQDQAILVVLNLLRTSNVTVAVK